MPVSFCCPRSASHIHRQGETLKWQLFVLSLFFFYTVMSLSLIQQKNISLATVYFLIFFSWSVFILKWQVVCVGVSCFYLKVPYDLQNLRIPSYFHNGERQANSFPFHNKMKKAQRQLGPRSTRSVKKHDHTHILVPTGKLLTYDNHEKSCLRCQNKDMW